MSDDPKLNEWKLLRDQFDARVREGSDIEVIFDAEFRRRFTELNAPISECTIGRPSCCRGLEIFDFQPRL
jgi:hypothetical protein